MLEAGAPRSDLLYVLAANYEPTRGLLALLNGAAQHSLAAGLFAAALVLAQARARWRVPRGRLDSACCGWGSLGGLALAWLLGPLGPYRRHAPIWSACEVSRVA